MSASPYLSPTVGREGGSVRASGASPARHRRTSVLVKLLLPLPLLVASGCSGDSPAIAKNTPSPTSSTSPSASPTPASEQEAILAQYKTFWASLTSVSRMPAAQRRAALEPFTVDPELKSLLAGMKATDDKGQVFYGANKPRATQASISPDGLKAVVDDCQDSTEAGVARRTDSARLTRGKERNHVVVTMQKSSDTWKVYFVSYTKTSC